MKLSLKQLETLVKEKYSLVKALNKIYEKNHYQVGQPCFCPFHENYHTPAASIYEDEKSQTLYCFTERKLYNVVDVFKNLMHYDVYQLGEGLWKSMSKEEQHVWLVDHDDSFIEAFNKKEEAKSSKNLLLNIELFKNKKISLDCLLENYINEK